MIKRTMGCWANSSDGAIVSGIAFVFDYLFVLVVVSLFATTTLWGQAPPITDIAFAPDGKSVITCSQKGLQVFCWPDLKLQETVKVSFANLHCLEFSPDGKRLAVGGGNPSEEGGVEVFSWPECISQMKFVGHEDSVVSMVWQGNKVLVTASLDHLLIQWDLEAEQAMKTFRGHSRGVNSACILKSGELVTAGHDHSVRVWAVDTGEAIRSLNQHSMPVNSIAVCPATDNIPMVATAAGDRSIRFWQPTIGRMMRYVRLESEPLDIAWFSESQIVASCVDGNARLVDTENVTVIQTIPMIKGWAYAVAVHPNDQTVAIAGSEGQLRRVGFQVSKD